MLKSAVRREEALTVPERRLGLWLREQNSAVQEFALQKYKRVGKRHIFLFSLAGVGRKMMLCLEFREYFSRNFCPLVLVSVLTSEVTGVGLTFSPLSYILYTAQAAFAGYRRVVTGAVFLFHASPVQPDPQAARAELGWEQSIVHFPCWWCSVPCIGCQCLCTWRVVVVCLFGHLGWLLSCSSQPVSPRWHN